MSIMSEVSNTDSSTSVWTRWVITVVTVIVVNVGTVAWLSGQYSRQIENNTNRVTIMEQQLRDYPTRESFNDIKADIREIKADVKELNKRK